MIKINSTKIIKEISQNITTAIIKRILNENNSDFGICPWEKSF